MDKAIVCVEGCEKDVKNAYAHIYVFPKEITEREFAVEVNELKTHYKIVEVNDNLPPHIRKNFIMNGDEVNASEHMDSGR